MGGRLRSYWHLLRTGLSLYPNGQPHRFLGRHMTAPGRTFGEIRAVRLYIAAVRLRDGAIKVFGDDPQEPILEAVMASTAVPLLFPPWMYGGEQWIDGGTLADVPVRLAVERGARRIYAVHVVASRRWESPLTRRGCARGWTIPPCWRRWPTTTPRRWSATGCSARRRSSSMAAGRPI